MKKPSPLAGQAASLFEARFGRAPAGIARAPGRVNLIGEHVDYNAGWVLPAAIDRAAFLAFEPVAAPELEVVAADLGQEVHLALPDPGRAAAEQAAAFPAWARYPAGVSWALQRAGLAVPGLRGVIVSDVPIGSGLGSSAAVEMAFGVAWQALGAWKLSRLDLARYCQQAENEFVGVRCGLMDQFASGLGAPGQVLLLDCRLLTWECVPVPEQAVLMIADTGVRRQLGASAYNERRAQCEEAVRLLKGAMPGITALRDVSPEALGRHADLLPPLVCMRAEHVVEECARTRAAAHALREGHLAEVGRLMNASHDSLRDLYQVSGPELDAMVDAARLLPGCYGARLTGAGFGGCTIELIALEQAGLFGQRLAEAYACATGLRAEVLVTAPAAGAGVL